MPVSNKNVMKQLSDMGSHAWLPGITEICQNIGLGEFDQTMFRFLNEILFIDHFAVFTYSEQDGTGHLFTKSIMPSEEAEGLAKDYVDEYHQRDPHFSQAKDEQENRDGEAVHPSLSDEYDPDYRDHFFTQHDLIDKISITRKVDDDYIYCNFYRIGESGQFTPEERQLFDSVLPLITSLIACHFKILHLQGESNPAEVPTARSLVHSVISRKVEPFDKLTKRESEVCERILVGFTSTGISLDLGIAESSVNTYRRRAYEKLVIATQNELFSLCISALNLIKK
jgi:DNA-binding CsgD family transcriptional regulator